MVLLPGVLRRQGKELARGGPLRVRGVVREDDTGAAGVVRELRLVADPGGLDGAA